MRVRWSWTCPLLFSGCLLVRASLAAEEAVVLGYEAPSECPPRGDLVDQVRELGHELVEREAAPRRLLVSITRIDAGLRGSLIVEERGERSEREVVSAACADVVAALALAIALALAPSDSPARPEPKASLRRTPIRKVPAREAPRVARDDLPLWNLSVRPGLASAFAPSVSPVLGMRAQRRSSWVALALGATALLPRESERAQYSGLFFQAVLGGELVRGARFQAGVPLLFEAGPLRAEGREVPNPERQLRPWLAVGSGFFGRWIAVGPAFVELEVLGIIPLVRQRFLIATPERQLELDHAVPRLGHRIELGLGSFL